MNAKIWAVVKHLPGAEWDVNQRNGADATVNGLLAARLVLQGDQIKLYGFTGFTLDWFVSFNPAVPLQIIVAATDMALLMKRGVNVR